MWVDVVEQIEPAGRWWEPYLASDRPLEPSSGSDE
jgi:hypothetical protein